MSKNKAKIIVFANQKGGVGKTTLCALFANHLAADSQSVSVKDADLQASIVNHRKDDIAQRPEVEPEWAVEWVDATKQNGMEKAIKRWRGEADYVVVDAPGSLALNGMAPILSAADVVVVPMTFDHDVLQSTFSFLKVVRRLNKDARFVIVPNRIDPRVGTAEERAEQERAAAELRGVGTLTPLVKQLAAVKRYSTLLGNDRQQEDATHEAFSAIERAMRGSEAR